MPNRYRSEYIESVACDRREYHASFEAPCRSDWFLDLRFHTIECWSFDDCRKRAPVTNKFSNENRSTPCGISHGRIEAMSYFYKPENFQ